MTFKHANRVRCFIYEGNSSYFRDDVSLERTNHITCNQVSFFDIKSAANIDRKRSIEVNLWSDSILAVHLNASTKL